MANRPIHVVESGGDSTGLKEFADGADSGVQLPGGTTAQRDSSASAGETRFNTDTKKLEYYDGAKWQSSTFINVDDADYDGVLTIESTQYARDTSGFQPVNNGNWNAYGVDKSSTNWGWSQTQTDGNTSSIISKFLPFGHPNAHAGATEADLRFGPTGYNSLEAEKTQRSSPILELASNAPQTAMTNRYKNMDQHAGGLAFTVNTNDYFDNGYNPGGEFAGKRAFLSGITNFVEGNSVGYYGYDGPNNLMTFWSSTAVGGAVPWLSVGQAKYDQDAIGPQINFFTGGRTNISTSTPSRGSTWNKGTQIRLRPGNDWDNSTTINYEEFVTTGTGNQIAHEFTEAGATGPTSFVDGDNWVMFLEYPKTNGRIVTCAVQDTKRLNKIVIAYTPAGGDATARDYKFLIKNTTNANKTFKIDKNALNVAKVESLKVPTVTNYATATSATAVTNVNFDSSFPSGGSDTTYTITPRGFVSFDLTIFYLTNGAATGSALFHNLQTAGV